MPLHMSLHETNLEPRAVGIFDSLQEQQQQQEQESQQGLAQDQQAALVQEALDLLAQAPLAPSSVVTAPGESQQGLTQDQQAALVQEALDLLAQAPLASTSILTTPGDTDTGQAAAAAGGAQDAVMSGGVCIGLVSTAPGVGLQAELGATELPVLLQSSLPSADLVVSLDPAAAAMLLRQTQAAGAGVGAGTEAELGFGGGDVGDAARAGSGADAGAGEVPPPALVQGLVGRLPPLPPATLSTDAVSLSGTEASAAEESARAGADVPGSYPEVLSGESVASADPQLPPPLPSASAEAKGALMETWQPPPAEAEARSSESELSWDAQLVSDRHVLSTGDFLEKEQPGWLGGWLQEEGVGTREGVEEGVAGGVGGREQAEGREASGHWPEAVATEAATISSASLSFTVSAAAQAAAEAASLGEPTDRAAAAIAAAASAAAVSSSLSGRVPLTPEAATVSQAASPYVANPAAAAAANPLAPPTQQPTQQAAAALSATAAVISTPPPALVAAAAIVTAPAPAPSVAALAAGSSPAPTLNLTAAAAPAAAPTPTPLAAKSPTLAPPAVAPTKVPYKPKQQQPDQRNPTGGIKVVPALCAAAIGLAVKFLAPCPVGVTAKAWTLTAVFCSTVAGKWGVRGEKVLMWL